MIRLLIGLDLLMAALAGFGFYLVVVAEPPSLADVAPAAIAWAYFVCRLVPLAWASRPPVPPPAEEPWGDAVGWGRDPDPRGRP